MPTAIQFFSHGFLLFGSDGVQYLDPSESYGLRIPQGAWALSDSGVTLQKPSEAFQNAEAKVILASSPAETRWKEWQKQSSASLYLMDLWDNSELGALACVLPRESSSTQLMSL